MTEADIFDISLQSSPTLGTRIVIIQFLKNATKQSFENTEDFHKNMETWLSTLPVYNNFVGTDPLVTKSIQIWADKRKALTQKLIPLKVQGSEGDRKQPIR